MAFYETWNLREDAMLDELITQLNAVAGTPFATWVKGKNAFLGDDLNRYNAFSFEVSGGNDASQTYKPSRITELRMDAKITALFEERKVAQQFGFMLFDVLPFQDADVTGVQWLRMRENGNPRVRKVSVVLAGNSGERTLNLLEMDLETVFNVD